MFYFFICLDLFCLVPVFYFLICLDLFCHVILFYLRVKSVLTPEILFKSTRYVSDLVTTLDKILHFEVTNHLQGKCARLFCCLSDVIHCQSWCTEWYDSFLQVSQKSRLCASFPAKPFPSLTQLLLALTASPSLILPRTLDSFLTQNCLWRSTS